jgi:hypothetical protein
LHVPSFEFTVNGAERQAQLTIGDILRSGHHVDLDLRGLVIWRPDMRVLDQPGSVEVGAHLDVLRVPWWSVRAPHPAKPKRCGTAIIVFWRDLTHLRSWLPAEVDRLAAEWKRRRVDPGQRGAQASQSRAALSLVSPSRTNRTSPSRT